MQGFNPIVTCIRADGNSRRDGTCLKSTTVKRVFPPSLVADDDDDVCVWVFGKTMGG